MAPRNNNNKKGRNPASSSDNTDSQYTNSQSDSSSWLPDPQPPQASNNRVSLPWEATLVDSVSTPDLQDRTRDRFSALFSNNTTTSQPAPQPRQQTTRRGPPPMSSLRPTTEEDSPWEASVRSPPRSMAQQTPAGGLGIQNVRSPSPEPEAPAVRVRSPSMSSGASTEVDMDSPVNEKSRPPVDDVDREKEIQKQKESVEPPPAASQIAADIAQDPYSVLPPDQAAMLKSQVETHSRKYGYFDLYRFAVWSDYVIIAISIVCAIAAGAAMPLMTIIFGGMAKNFSDYFMGFQSYNAFVDDMTGYVLYFVYLGIGSFVTSYIYTVGFLYTGEHITIKIREEYLASCLRQNIGFFDNLAAGEVVQRITADTNQVQEGLSEKVATAINQTATFISGFVIAFAFYWKLTLILTATVVTLLLNTLIGTKVISRYSLPSLEAYISGATLADEVLGSVRNALAFGTQDVMADRYLKHLEKGENLGFKVRHLAGWVVAVMMSVVYLNFGLGFWQGSTFYLKGEANLGDILTVMMAIMIGAFSMGGIAPSFQAFMGALAAATQILKTIDRPSPIDSSSDQGQTIPNVKGHVRLENIKHIYPSRPDVTVMHNVSLDIPAGKVTALVGASGSGKSTIVGLLERFYLPAEGTMYLDGVDISKLNLRWLRQQISLVSQEPTLFSTTVFQNIKFGLIGSRFEHESEERQRDLVISAAKMANAHDFITALSEGYETDVGESGFLLSGGQKQRIAIARAVVSDPKILLLDEATSALDTKSEGIVQEALEIASEGRTTITIAHRLSTIRDADNIVVMIAGKIIEQGNHNQLLAMNGAYSKLVNAQQIQSKRESQVSDEDDEDEVELLRRKSRAWRNTTHRKSSFVQRQSLWMRDSGHIRQSAFFRPSIWRGSGVFTGNEPFGNNDDWGLYAGNNDTSRFSVYSESSIGIDESPEEEKYSMWTLIKFVSSFNKQDKIWVAIGIICSVIVGGASPTSAVFYGKQVTALSRPLVDDAAKDQIRDDSNFWSRMYLMLGIVQFLANGTSGFAFAIACERLLRRVRYETFRRLLRQDVAFYDKDENSAGALTSFLAIETQNMAGLSGAALGTMVQAVTTLISGITVATAIGWKLALVCVSTMPVLLGCGFFRVYMLAKFQRTAKAAYTESATYASEAITSIRTVATLTREQEVWERYHKSLMTQRKKSTKSILRSSIVFAASQSLVFFCNGLGFWYGGTLIAKREYNMFQFFVCFMAVINGAQSAGTFFSLAPDMGKAHLAAGDIKRLFDRKPEVDAWDEDGKVVAKVDGQVEFRNVQFRYPTRPEQPVLRGLDLDIQPGQYVALVGGSGCGKSTTIGLMERFYDPLAGSIFVDGKDISTLNINDYRSFIALVSQEPTLYAGTILDNITIGAARQEVTEQDVEQACKDANIYDFIMSLPDGFNTTLGPKGGMLSGGQKQRIAIARALVRNPKILLLDEATSALDSESEHVVQAALDKAAKGRTTITIAHRLSTIQHADCIFVFEQGRVVEKGTHWELMKKQGAYAELVNMQSLDKQKKKKEAQLAP